MSRILVPYDRSDQADCALDHALSMSGSATVVLLNVLEPSGDYTGLAGHEPSGYSGQRENATEMLAGVCEGRDDSDRIETAVRYGRPAHAVLAYVDEATIDHVVIGSHGRDGVARLLLGSVAETVTRRSPVPVTVVRNSEMSGGSDHVLVPFDGSTHARRALAYALESFAETSITALYVAYPSSGSVVDSPGVETPQGWEGDPEEHAQSVLASATEIADEHGRRVDTRTAAGTPADAIVEFAADTDIEHIVLGSTGRDGVARLLLGSVAETVVRRSPASVTVAK